MTFLTDTRHRTPAQRPTRSLLSRLLLRDSLFRQRHDLGRLDAHLLRDIGLSPDDAAAESRRPIWDAPAHWRSLS